MVQMLLVAIRASRTHGRARARARAFLPDAAVGSNWTRDIREKRIPSYSLLQLVIRNPLPEI